MLNRFVPALIVSAGVALAAVAARPAAPSVPGGAGARQLVRLTQAELPFAVPQDVTLVITAVAQATQQSSAPTAVLLTVDGQPALHCSTALSVDYVQRPIGGGVVELGDGLAVRSGEVLDGSLGAAPINWGSHHQSPFVLLGYLTRP